MDHNYVQSILAQLANPEQKLAADTQTTNYNPALLNMLKSLAQYPKDNNSFINSGVGYINNSDPNNQIKSNITYLPSLLTNFTGEIAPHIMMEMLSTQLNNSNTGIK